jgi:hypothetical protein
LPPRALVDRQGTERRFKAPSRQAACVLWPLAAILLQVA